MPPSHIVIDIDGVVADFNASLIRRLAAAGFDISNIKQSCWDYPLLEVPGMSRTKYRDFMHTTMKDPTFWRGIPTLGGYALYERLEMAGMAITFITQRPAQHRHITESWLDVNFPGRPALVMARNKGLVIAGMGDVKAILDDKPENLLDVLRANGTDVECYLLKRPYNRSHTLKHIIEVDTLEEFGDYCVNSYGGAHD